ncbi:MAG: TolC family protein [Planctomycetia bacterium]|nr:TolC family protein [Planctomycetia bacterium]
MTSGKINRRGLAGAGRFACVVGAVLFLATAGLTCLDAALGQEGSVPGTILPLDSITSRSGSHLVPSPTAEPEYLALSDLATRPGVHTTAPLPEGKDGITDGRTLLTPATGGVQVEENAVVFGETLDAAWTRALALSRDLQSKSLQTDAARWNTKAARGLALPKISNTTAAVSMEEQPYFHSTIPGLSPPGGIPMPIAEDEYVASVTTLTVPLYLGGRVRGMIDSANALTKALASGEKIGEQELKYQVTETYFLVLRVRRVLEVAEEAASTLARHEHDAQRLFENGLVTRNVVLAAGVAKAEAEQDVIKARNGVQLAEAAYNRLLWRPLNTPVAVMDEEVPPLSGDYDSLVAQAVASRPELSALCSQSQALSAQQRVHRADRMPHVALVGLHSYWENEYVTPNSNFTGAVGMVWVPFDGGTSRSRQEASNLEAMAVAKQSEDARKSIELQVYQYWLAEQETRERLKVATLAVGQADENLRVVSRSFQEGLTNHTEVLDAQTLRTQAWNNLANTRYDAILATWQLRRALGRL